MSAEDDAERERGARKAAAQAEYFRQLREKDAAEQKAYAERAERNRYMRTIGVCTGAIDEFKSRAVLMEYPRAIELLHEALDWLVEGYNKLPTSPPDPSNQQLIADAMQRVARWHEGDPDYSQSQWATVAFRLKHYLEMVEGTMSSEFPTEAGALLRALKAERLHVTEVVDRETSGNAALQGQIDSLKQLIGELKARLDAQTPPTPPPTPPAPPAGE